LNQSVDMDLLGSELSNVNINSSSFVSLYLFLPLITIS